VGMRALPAIFGSLTVPVVYGIMKESGYGNVISAFSASIVLFGAYSIFLLRFSSRLAFFFFSQTTHTLRSRASYYWTPHLYFSYLSPCIPTFASVSCDTCMSKAFSKFERP
jgi:dolichyl-phosphate-mannose--protein O-mannosyl transferase